MPPVDCWVDLGTTDAMDDRVKEMLREWNSKFDKEKLKGAEATSLDTKVPEQSENVERLRDADIERRQRPATDPGHKYGGTSTSGYDTSGYKDQSQS